MNNIVDIKAEVVKWIENIANQNPPTSDGIDLSVLEDEDWTIEQLGASLGIPHFSSSSSTSCSQVLITKPKSAEICIPQCSPLHIASHQGHSTIIEKLLLYSMKGSSVNSTDQVLYTVYKYGTYTTSNIYSLQVCLLIICLCM